MFVRYTVDGLLSSQNVGLIIRFKGKKTISNPKKEGNYYASYYIHSNMSYNKAQSAVGVVADWVLVYPRMKCALAVVTRRDRTCKHSPQVTRLTSVKETH